MEFIDKEQSMVEENFSMSLKKFPSSWEATAIFLSSGELSQRLKN
jgi:hypothetical protein